MAISSLFEGFGSEPSWELRERAIAARLEQLKNSGAAFRNPATGHFGVMRFEKQAEVAGFIAALSRFLNAPQGNAHRTGLVEVDVWHRSAAQGVQELWLNDEALNATTAAFGMFA